MIVGVYGMAKYFTFTFYKEGSHDNTDDKTLRTWTEVMRFLKDMYVDCDMITIRYVGER